MCQIDSSTVQVIIVFLEEYEFFVCILAGSFEIADVAALVVDVEQLVVAQ